MVTKLLAEADEYNTDKSAAFTVSVDSYANYAAQLKSYRKRHRLKQVDLAGMLGISVFTLGNWEQNRAKPSFNVWRQFLEYAGKDS